MKGRLSDTGYPVSLLFAVVCPAVYISHVSHSGKCGYTATPAV